MINYPAESILNYRGIDCYFYPPNSDIQLLMGADNSDDGSQEIILGTMSIPEGQNPCDYILICKAWIDKLSDFLESEEVSEISEIDLGDSL